jgi:hypothetical protein
MTRLISLASTVTLITLTSVLLNGQFEPSHAGGNMRLKGMLLQYDIVVTGGDVTILANNFVASNYTFMKERPCSFTVVGPETILTAAHCVKGGYFITPETDNARSFYVVCESAPDHAAPGYRDFALCRAADRTKDGTFEPTSDAFKPADYKNGFEVLSFDAARIAAKKTLLLTGHGCDHNTLARIGTFRGGWATVLESEANGNRIRTTGASACFGDSGGGVYAVTDKDIEKRVLVGVNSACCVPKKTDSYTAILPTKDAQQFVEDWAARQKVQVCGVKGYTKDCRQP